MKLIILLPTRDRTLAFHDACMSIERAVTTTKGEIRFEVIVVDSSKEKNHDVNKKIIKSKIKGCPTTMYRTSTSHTMTVNWETGIKLCQEKSYSALMVLADRRLLTKNIHLATKLFDTTNDPSKSLLAFDHQNTWIGKNQISSPKYTFKAKKYELARFAMHAIKNSEYDGLTPRMYNCVIGREIIELHKKQNGSFIGAPYPDISFLYRCSLSNIDYEYITIDAPLIATNQLFAHLTASPYSSVDKITDASKDESYVDYNKIDYIENIRQVYSVNTAHAYQYYHDDLIKKMINAEKFIEKSCWELSCPQDKAIFTHNKNALINMVNERTVFCGSITTDQQEMLIKFINNVKHQELAIRDKIQDQNTSLCTKDLDALQNVEIRNYG